MRRFLPLLLAPSLAAQAPEPGVPMGFRDRVMHSIATDPLDLWRKEIRMPVFSAVVEVLGEITREEKQQIAFVEMQTRLLAELHELLKGSAPSGGRGAGLLPPTQPNGSRGASLAPLTPLRARF